MWPIIKKAVNSDLSTPLNTLINNVKSIVNTVNSTVNTIKSTVNTVKSTVDTVKTNVGSNADSASSTGSVHAKLKYIAANTGIKSIQRGMVTLDKNEYRRDVTISNVNVNKTMVNFLGVNSTDAYATHRDDATNSYYHTASIAHALVTLRLTNNTTVTVERKSNAQAIRDTECTVSYEVIEFV